MKVKKGDTVRVIAGSEKGKEGVILKTFAETERVIVEGVKIVKKHVKPNQLNPDGAIINKEAAIHVSNVMLIDPKNKKQLTRVGYRMENGKKVRVAKKSNAVIN